MNTPQDPMQRLWQQHTAPRTPLPHRRTHSQHALQQLQQRMRREVISAGLFIGASSLALGYDHPVWRVWLASTLLLLAALTAYNWWQSQALFAATALTHAPHQVLRLTLTRLLRYLRIYQFIAYALSALPLPVLWVAMAVDHPALPRQSLVHTWLAPPYVALTLAMAVGIVWAQHRYLRHYLQRHYWPQVQALQQQLSDWEQADAQLN